jgi:hypothetical protein
MEGTVVSSIEGTGDLRRTDHDHFTGDRGRRTTPHLPEFGNPLDTAAESTTDNAGDVTDVEPPGPLAVTNGRTVYSILLASL